MAHVPVMIIGNICVTLNLNIIDLLLLFKAPQSRLLSGALLKVLTKVKEGKHTSLYSSLYDEGIYSNLINLFYSKLFDFYPTLF